MTFKHLVRQSAPWLVICLTISLPFVAYANDGDSTAGSAREHPIASTSPTPLGICRTLEEKLNGKESEITHLATGIGDTQTKGQNEQKQHQEQVNKKITEGSAKFATHLDSEIQTLTAKAQTEAQKNAVMVFASSIKAAVDTYQTSIKANFTIYSTAIDAALATRNTAIKTAATALAANFTTATHTTTTNCQIKGDKGRDEIRSNFVQTMSAARITFETTRKQANLAFKAASDAAAATRKQKDVAARSSYTASVHTATTTLQAAFPVITPLASSTPTAK